MTELEQSLVAYCQEDAANIAVIRSMRADALSKIREGGGQISSIISGSLNGKSYSQTVNMDCAQVFAMCGRILKALAGETSGQRSTQIDFRCLTH